MNKLVMACVIILAIVAGAGVMLGVMHFLPMGGADHAEAMAKTDNSAHPQSIFFAELPDVVVSIPPQAGAPATSYVQIGMQFSTHDHRAVDSFTTLQPIIKSQVINLLMSETSAALQDPATRALLVQNCLNIANGVLAKNAGGKSTDKPFDAAYITNLVVQD
jgi:flagellar basal body-associated protein FliL